MSPPGTSMYVHQILMEYDVEVACSICCKEVVIVHCMLRTAVKANV